MPQLDLNSPEGVYVGLDALNLTPKSWDVQFDGGKTKHPIVDYGHGARETTVWLRFTVTQDNIPVVLQGEWDLASKKQTLKKGSSAATLKVVSQIPFNDNPFIEPGISHDGSQVWFRYGEHAPGDDHTPSGDHTKEYRFHTPIHVDSGRIGSFLEKIALLGA